MLIDKIRKLVDKLGSPVTEAEAESELALDYSIQMARALIAVDNVLKDMETYGDPFAASDAKEIRKAMESTEPQE